MEESSAKNLALLSVLSIVFAVTYYLSFGSWISDAWNYGSTLIPALLLFPMLALLIAAVLIWKKKKLGWFILHVYSAVGVGIGALIWFDILSALERLSGDYSIGMFMHGPALWITIQLALAAICVGMLQSKQTTQGFGLSKTTRIVTLFVSLSLAVAVLLLGS